MLLNVSWVFDLDQKNMQNRHDEDEDPDNNNEVTRQQILSETAEHHQEQSFTEDFNNRNYPPQTPVSAFNSQHNYGSFTFPQGLPYNLTNPRTLNLPPQSSPLGFYQTEPHFGQISSGTTPVQYFQTQPGQFSFQQFDEQQQHDIYSNESESHGYSEKRANKKSGSVISPEDRKPPTDEEFLFYETQVELLQSLIINNLQHLSFFNPEDWLQEYKTSLLKVTKETAQLDEVKQEEAVEFTALFQGGGSEFEPLRYHKQDLETLSVEQALLPQIDSRLKEEIESLTIFQRNLARQKCREVLGFYKLLLKGRGSGTSKVHSAQLMEHNSTFVVRTILNWGREYFKNKGRFNKSKIGKHQRESLFTNQEFKDALVNFAEDKGSNLSVDAAMQFIHDYYNRHKHTSEVELHSPPTSRATVHRWLRQLNIQLGPRGKKKKL